MWVRRASVALALVAASAPWALATAPAAHAATTWVYPTACNNAATLQACVDGAAAGDTVTVNSLQAADDGAYLGVRDAISVVAPLSAHITLPGGFMQLSQGASRSTPMSVRMSGITFSGTFTYWADMLDGDELLLDHLTYLAGATFGATVSKADTIEVTSSTFHVYGASDAVNIGPQQTSGRATIRIIGNTIDGSTSTNGNSGIDVQANGAGTDLTIANNSIWQTSQQHYGAGIEFIAEPGTVNDVNIVGNTIDHSGGEGIQFYESTSNATGSTAFRVWNNLITNSYSRAIDLQNIGVASAPFSYSGGYNNGYNNADPDNLGTFSAGPGAMHVAPHYVDSSTGNLALTSASPLLDQGPVCTPAGVAVPDAAGHRRLAGSKVDIGAFERNAVSTKGSAILGTAGPDVLQGTSSADIICGYAGADQIHAGGGDDYVDAGGDADYAYGEGGNDRILGGSGNDLADGGSGNDSLTGGDGGDHVVGGTGKDSLYGNGGSDPCLDSHDGVGGNDHVNGGSGTDRAHIDSGDAKTSIEGTCTSS